MVVGDSGNVYVCGNFNEDDTIGGIVIKSDSLGSTNIFVASYDKSGRVEWVRKVGGASAGGGLHNYAYGFKVLVDLSHNVYVVGFYQDTAEFIDTVMRAPVSTSVFVAKYDPAGNRLWIKTIMPDIQPFDWLHAGGLSMTASSMQDHLYIGESAYDGQSTYKSSLLEFDTAGKIVWQKDMPFTKSCQNLFVDSARHLYFNGSRLLSDASEYVLLVAKLNSTGDLVWTFTNDSSGPGGSALAADDQGNVYVCGAFAGRLHFGDTVLTLPNSFSDIFLLKLDAQGKFMWARQAGGDRPDNAFALSLDKQGNVYMVGTYQAYAQFGTESLQGDNNSRTPVGYLVKYDTAGNEKWALRPDGTGLWTPASVFVNKATNILYLSGFFQGDATFGNATVFDSGSRGSAFLASMDITKTSGVAVPQVVSGSLESYPNPFTSSTSIRFNSQESGYALVTVTNILGREVARLFAGELAPGEHTLKWDAREMVAGKYFCNMRFKDRTEIVPIMLLR